MTETGDSKITSWQRPALACLAILIATTLVPGDTQWLGDDKTLISNALAANAAHRLADRGLAGTVGLFYGPLPTEFYQALLALTRSLPAIVQIHAALFIGVTAAALLWLARSLHWSPWLVPLPLLSPYTWFYARLLWDNTLCIPIGTLMLASWAAYLRHGSRRAFATTAATAAVLPLIHPMALPLVGAVAAHALLFHRDALRRHLVVLLMVAIGVTVTNANYLRTFDWGRLSEMAAAPMYAVLLHAPPRWSRILFPLLNGRLQSATPFLDDRGPEPGLETGFVGGIARQLSTLAYLLVWIGLIAWIAMWIRRAGRRLRSWWARETHAQSTDPSPSLSIDTTTPERVAHAVGGICLAAFAAQAVVHGVLRLPGPSHYFCGTWPASVFLLWTGLRTLGRVKLDLVVGLLLALGLATYTVMFAIDIHRNHGGRVWYGPTLGSQTVLDLNHAPAAH